MEELQNLYKLQEIELQLEKLQQTQKSLPVIAEFKKLQAETVRAKEKLLRAKSDFAELCKQQKRLEHSLQRNEEEQKAVHNELYKGMDHSPKELEQLTKKAEILKDEQREQEEKLLDIMEKRDEQEKNINTITKRYQEMRGSLLQLQKSGKAELQEIRSQKEKLLAERQLLLQQISPALIDEYRKRRKQFHGRPVVEVAGNVCSGCRVSVSSLIKSSLRQGGKAIRCENCGRLLIMR